MTRKMNIRQVCFRVGQSIANVRQIYLKVKLKEENISQIERNLRQKKYPQSLRIPLGSLFFPQNRSWSIHV